MCGLQETERLFFWSVMSKGRRKWQPSPVCLPEESQGRRSLVGCRLWGCRESDMTEATQQQEIKVKVIQLCPALCNPMDYKGYGILRARILELVTFPFSRGYSQPRDQTQVSCIAGRFFASSATRGAFQIYHGKKSQYVPLQ